MINYITRIGVISTLICFNYGLVKGQDEMSTTALGWVISNYMDTTVNDYSRPKISGPKEDSYPPNHYRLRITFKNESKNTKEDRLEFEVTFSAQKKLVNVWLIRWCYGEASEKNKIVFESVSIVPIIGTHHKLFSID